MCKNIFTATEAKFLPNIKPTAWLQIPAKLRLRQSPTNSATIASFSFAARVATVRT
jgi:hypothetical protein